MADRDDRPDYALWLPEILEALLPKYRVTGAARSTLADSLGLGKRVLEVRLRRRLRAA